jgi:hypothetical protein
LMLLTPRTKQMGPDRFAPGAETPPKKKGENGRLYE